VIHQNRKTAQQTPTTTGTARKIFTNNNVPDSSLMAEKIQLMAYRCLNGTTGAAGPVPMNKGQHLEALACSNFELHVQPGQGLTYQWSAFFQVNQTMNRSDPWRKLGRIFNLAVGAESSYLLYFIAANTAKHHPHLNQILTTMPKPAIVNACGPQ
jgi:hypothetical protein